MRTNLIATAFVLTIVWIPAVCMAQSRGVPVVHSASPKWGAAAAWKVESAHVLEIGVTNGAEPYLFHDPSGVLKLSDGRIVIADMGSSQVRFYDARGRHLKTIGRQGDGPGEYRQISGLRRMNGDSILVVEFDRANVTTTDGRHVRVIPLPQIPGVRARPHAWFGDGSNVATDWPQGRGRTGTWTDSSHLYLIDRNGATVRALGTSAAVTYAFKDEVAMPVQFGPIMSLTAGNSEYFLSYPESYRIDVYGLDGTKKRTITRAWQPLPVTSGDIKRYGDSFVNEMSESGTTSPQFKAFRQKRLDQTTFAKQIPAFGAMRVDSEGNLWVQDGRPMLITAGQGFGKVNAEPTRFDVFDRSGAWLGSVQTPPQLRVMDIGRDYFAGMYVGEDDVQTIRFYRLMKPVTR